MRKVPAAKVVTALEGLEMPLPAEIQEALGELVGAAREGLLALSVGVGLGVVHELIALLRTRLGWTRARRSRPSLPGVRPAGVPDSPATCRAEGRGFESDHLLSCS
jgi:hypothetical protein